MRVLTVGNMYPPHHLGGYELDWAAGVAALRNVGHEVRVLTSDHREAGVDAPDEDGIFRDLRWYWHDHEFPRRSLLERFSIERHNARVLNSQLAGFRPELVSWWPMGGMSLSLIERVKRLGLPAIGIVYDDWMVYGRRVDAWLATWRRKPRIADSARWFFASDSVRRAAIEAVPSLRGEETELLPPGLDEVFLDPAPAREWRWKLVAPGRLDPRKGLRTAVEALALLPQAELLVIGGGDSAYGAELHALADELGVRERFEIAPPRTRPDLVAAYGDADAVVFPVTWAEPFGLVPLEAMGVGRPVVATGRGGSGEFLRDDENCLLFEPGDARGLAAAVERLAADEALRDRLRSGGFETAPAYARSRWDARVVTEHERAAER